jgi:hypothetical protein
MQEYKRFASRWEEFDLIPLGGFWAICVGTIVDNLGIRKIRIAKGKIKGRVWKEKGEIRYELQDDKDPITQVNRLNLKSEKEWEQIKRLVEKHLPKLRRE